MIDESNLREMARAAIQTGKLPVRRPDRTWAGKGGGADCAVCSELLAAGDIEMEIEFTDRQADTVGNHSFHMRCFAAWEFERESVSRHEHGLSEPRASG